MTSRIIVPENLVGKKIFYNGKLVKIENLLSIHFMEEQLVSFETAKLAHEKGYNIKTWPLQYYRTELKPNEVRDTVHNSTYVKSFLTPTQSLLAKWLREVHQIHIDIIFKNNIKKWDCSPYSLELNGLQYVKFYKEYFKGERKKLSFDSYEVAFEAGLFEALKLIK